MHPSKRWSEALRDRERGGLHQRLRATLRDGLRGEDGSAALEFITVGMLMLVPLVYLIVALGMIQGQSLGAEAGARHIARAVSTAPDAASATARADAVLRSIVDEYDIDPGSVHLSLACVPTATACPDAGSTIVVTITTAVALPMVPPVLGLDRLAVVPIEARAVQKVSRFWGTE